MVDRDALIVGERLGQGGQGTVYRVPNRKINNARGTGWDVVYKEYNDTSLAQLDTAALAAMVGLLTELTETDGHWLCNKTAWPAALVERRGRACGILMRAVPQEFHFTFRTLAATTPPGPRLANLEYLLNDDSYVAGIGLRVSDRDRIELLADLASTLSRLHDLGIVVGDLSPKNLVFTTGSTPRCFLIDCDAMRLRGASVLPQAETPDWAVPLGQEKANRASDVYKFALLAIRLFARDQTTTHTAALAAINPALGALAHRSLAPDTTSRPTPAQWAEQLRSAAPTASPAPGTAGPLTGPITGGAAHPGVWVAPPIPTTRARGQQWQFTAVVAAGVVITLIVALALLVQSKDQHQPFGADPLSSPSTTDRQWPLPTDDPGADTANPTRTTSTLVPSSPDPIQGAAIGACFYDTGTSAHPDLITASCVPGAFKVVHVFPDTTDLDSCDNVTDNDRTVSSARYNRVLCLSYLNAGGSAYHAHQGDCVYGPNSTGPWNTQPCRTGNFKVLAVYHDTDHTKCSEWPKYNEWKAFTGPDRFSLNRLLCLSMNYPDDAGYATINQCLLMSDGGSHSTFTDVGSCAASNVVVTGRTSTPDDPEFCGRDGSTTWQPPDFPALGYTVCWRQR